MQLQFPNEADVPVELKDSFVPFELDGATVFMHKDLAEAKKDSYRNQGQLTKLTERFSGLESSMMKQQEQALALQEAKAADELAAERARLEAVGDKSALGKLEAEIKEAEHQKIVDMLATRDTELVDMRNSITDAKKTEMASLVNAQFSDPRFAALVGNAIKERMISADGQVAMTDATGKAVPFDVVAISEMLQTEASFEAFAKAPASKAGVGATGGQQSTSGALDLNKPYSELTPKEKVARIKHNRK